MIDKDSRQFRNGFRIERKEHPTLTIKQVEQVVMDHIKIHPNAYR